MKISNLKIADIFPYEKNAKKHPEEQIEKIAGSIKEFGFVQPVVVDKDNVIVIGHGRVLAAKYLDMEEVPCLYAEELSEKQIRELRLLDNRLNESEWDKELLRQELLDLPEVALEFKHLDLFSGKIVPDDDKIPETPQTSEVKIGDIFQLGRHFVMCGDSTSHEHVERLLDGDKSDMVFTDPPYLMNFVGSVHSDGSKSHNASHGAIKNDKMSVADGKKFLNDICKVIKNFNKGAFYICFYRLGIDWMMNALTDVGLKWRNLIIWKKNNHNLSNSDYKSIYEPIVYGFDDDYTPIVYGWDEEHKFLGKKGERDVWETAVPSLWEIDKTKKNKLHPTTKPVELCVRAIQNSSKPDDLVLDLFLGSGSTLIACEKVGRICCGMELDPLYVDVIIKRWEDYTGKKANKIS